MYDQANDLRRLVGHCAAPKTPARRPHPSLAFITSGKGGVGTTTIAVNLAVALARVGLRTVLVDADPCGGDAAVLCGLEEPYTLADVLAGHRIVPEVLQPGPGGVRVLPGAWGLERLPNYPPAAGSRLLGQLEGLGAEADLVVLDAGNGPNRILQRFPRAARLILVVTTPETPSIIDTFAAISALTESDTIGPIHTLVNLAPTAQLAQDVQGRLARACSRFLGIQLQTAGHVPVDPQVATAAATAEPFVIAAPGCDAARHVDRLARKVAAFVTADKPRGKPSQNRKHGRVGMTA